MKRLFFCAAGVFLSVPAFLSAQTVTVPGSFSTIQAAINSFTPDPDPNTPNVINITNNAVYDEVITINAPVTLQGTSATSRPILSVKNNTPAADGVTPDGITILISTGTYNEVTLRNLIVIPSIASPVQDDMIRSLGQNLGITIDNVLVAPNNGANQPVSTTGLTSVSLAGATLIGDDGIFLGGGTSPGGGVGTTATLTNVIVTHVRATAPGGNDGLVLTQGGTNNLFTIKDGCVFSFCARVGIQAAGDFVINAPTTRTLVLGNQGFAGIWFAAASPTTRNLNGVNVLNNGTSITSGWGIEDQSNTANVPFNLTNSILAGNLAHGLQISELAGTGPVNVTNCTISNNGGRCVYVVPIVTPNVYTGTMTITDSILGGNGSGGPTNIVEHNGTGPMNIVNSARVLAGPSSLTGTGTGGTGTINITGGVTSDPLFITTSNFSSSSFFDVNSSLYGTAATGGTPLKGGAHYIGGVVITSASDWGLFQ